MSLSRPSSAAGFQVSWLNAAIERDEALLNDPERPLRDPSDLRHHTLLHELAEGIPKYVTWRQWLAYAGADDVDASHGPRFSHTFLALQAAASGQGIALATSAQGQADFATASGYAPINLGSKELMDAAVAEWLPESHTEGQVNLDLEYWAENRDDLGTRWYEWQAE